MLLYSLMGSHYLPCRENTENESPFYTPEISASSPSSPSAPSTAVLRRHLVGKLQISLSTCLRIPMPGQHTSEIHHKSWTGLVEFQIRVGEKIPSEFLTEIQVTQGKFNNTHTYFHELEPNTGKQFWPSTIQKVYGQKYVDTPSNYQVQMIQSLLLPKDV